MNIGDKIGCLTIIENELFIPKGNTRVKVCKCKCECGEESIKSLYALQNNAYKSCSRKCILKIKNFDSIVEPDKINIQIGQVFNNLTVIGVPFYKLFKQTRKRNLTARVQYVLCSCKCGKERIFQCPRLLKGITISCGCVRDNRRTYPPAKDGMKICKNCNINQATDNFTNCNKGADGLHYECKKCTRNRVLKKNYGIDNNDYEKMLLKQNNRCGCCQKTIQDCQQRHSYLEVDHDHNTGKVRGLLCTKCNQGIGLFFDNNIFLQNAIDYLNKDKNNINELLMF